ncbi:hypothetical protein Rt10032_c03g1491 [Rhodotorula toruloides]|uniref:Proteophosphoglycan ppg4 n=1 Tax=Rhodotorula toruloides TaxID=5286 RepID=A0A511KDI9_RHOTO|nr:hypothetical protein Rt10032_c03g1491 [Rhodotorula toruloides]
MARHTVLHLLTSVLATTAVFAAPAPIRTQAPEVKRGLEKRVDNVIVNIGAVTTVKTVVKTAVPVFVPVIVDGQTRTATSVVKVVEEITTTMTQTAVATKLTIPVTVTTTAFDLQLATITAVLQSTSTLYQQSVIIETKQGEPLRKTVTVAATPTDEGRPQPTKASDQQPIPSVWHKKPDDTGSPGAPTARQGQPSAANTADTGASAPETLSSAAPGDTSAPDNSLNLNNTANANSGSNATLDSSNTNTNNVTVSLGGSGGIGDWVSNNKTIVIVIGVGVAVALVIAIIAAVLECGGSKRSGGGGPATGVSLVLLAFPLSSAG